MSNTFNVDTTQLPVASVCVYQADRAEVHRILPVELEEGQNEIKIERLPSGVDPDSIRVEGTGNAVIFDVIHSPPPPVVLTTDKTKNPALHALNQREADLDAEKDILNQQETILKDYSSTLKSGVANAAKLAEFLKLYQEKKQQIFDELQTVDAKLREVHDEQDKVKKEFWADATGQKRQTSVTVVVLAQQKGKVELSVRYSGSSFIEQKINLLIYFFDMLVVNGASWTPMYDLRAKVSHAPGEASSISLQYKASITQNTGEDWTDVALTLSTAAPQLGATIPTLTPYKIGRPRPPPPPPQLTFSAPMAAMSLSMALPDDDADEEMMEADEDMGMGLFDAAEPMAVATAAAIEGATSSTFVIAGKSTIPSHQPDDEQTHKVSVAVIDLDAKLEWVAVPKAQTAAFLKVVVATSIDPDEC
ncbi:hypothetical protein FRB90_001809 [Tulasnella sp. 427]|nr:hypothetical protein FRB90_001809 [Tulasnella sp. 427]